MNKQTGEAMRKTTLAIFCTLIPLSAMVHAQEIATCRSPVGKAFRHFTGVQEKATAGWSEERITKGVVTLVKGADGQLDMLYLDVRNKPISMKQDGAKVLMLRSAQEELALLVHYEGSTTEIYSFFREKDGRHRYTVLSSRIGPNTFAPKSSVMVGDCDPIQFDLLR